MFSKLRTAKYLKTASSADSACVQFAGKVQRIARVHHYGLRERVSRRGPKVQYKSRLLLGFNDALEIATRSILIKWLMG
jgi:phage virion morphogenesis protein